MLVNCFKKNKTLTVNLSWCGTIMKIMGGKIETVIANYSLHFASKRIRLWPCLWPQGGWKLLHKPHTPVSWHTLPLFSPDWGRNVQHTSPKLQRSHSSTCKSSDIMRMKAFIHRHFPSSVQQPKQSCSIWQAGSESHDNQTLKWEQQKTVTAAARPEPDCSHLIPFRKIFQTINLSGSAALQHKWPQSSSGCSNRPVRPFSTTSPFTSSPSALSVSSTITNHFIFSPQRPLGRLTGLNNLHFALICLDRLTGEPEGETCWEGHTVINDAEKSAETCNDSADVFLLAIMCARVKLKKFIFICNCCPVWNDGIWNGLTAPVGLYEITYYYPLILKKTENKSKFKCPEWEIKYNIKTDVLLSAQNNFIMSTSIYRNKSVEGLVLWFVILEEQL